MQRGRGKIKAALLAFTASPWGKTYFQVPDLRCKGDCLPLNCTAHPCQIRERTQYEQTHTSTFISGKRTGISNTDESDKNKGRIWWSVYPLLRLPTPLLVLTRPLQGWLWFHTSLLRATYLYRRLPERQNVMESCLSYTASSQRH